ncbi:MAG: hypothetical protein Q9208_007618 [Pyrenodesmia sp. 3 TL-2023]
MQAPVQIPFTKENELLSKADHSPIPDNCIRLPDDLLVQRGELEDYLTSQLSVRRLNAIHDWLWRAGLPGRVQPLHHQRVLRRHILVTERIDLHLVWTDDQIFIKPLAPFLLHYAFFKQHLAPNPSLLPAALGFLHTYTKLIHHRTDFSLALELGLLPPSVTWPAWNRFRMDLLTRITHSQQINKRYHYGELRLSRLNTAYRFHQRSLRGGYFLVYTRYQSFFRANFEWLLLAFAYFSVVLSALQVLLSANQGYENTNRVLEGVSLALGSASILSVFLAVLIMAALFAILSILNENFARRRRTDVEHAFNLTRFETFGIKS